MSVLLLRLAGPMQSWGASSRFTRRGTEVAPTKSGVLGLLAAAQGIRRTEPITDLLGLEFGVRLDQPGQLLRDFQTAHTSDGKSAPLTYRFYLADAVFLAAVQGERALLEGLHEALNRPRFPLYLGRRSCPPDGRISLNVHDLSLDQAFRTWPWLAAGWFKSRSGPKARVEVIRDATADDRVTETIADQPISFDPAHRRYAWRAVTRRHVDLDNDKAGRTDHYPMSLLGG